VNLHKEYTDVAKHIKIITQLIDTSTGKIEQESEVHQERLQAPTAMDALGYDHKTQIALLQSLQNFKLKN
jgi:hypothetical protein